MRTTKSLLEETRKMVIEAQEMLYLVISFAVIMVLLLFKVPNFVLDFGFAGVFFYGGGITAGATALINFLILKAIKPMEK